VTGFITSFVGTGVGPFNGDGQPGTATNLANPHGLAFDAAGNLFIADSSQQRIRRVDAVTGLVSTVAGTGVGGFNGDAVPATAAQLLGPFALAFDPAGNLYIADLGNQRIRKVDAVLGLISTVAGMGAAGFNGDGILATTAQLNNPTGIVFDRVGNLFIADQSNNRVRLVDAATGLISTIAGTGVPGFNGDGIPATSAQLNLPVSLAFDQLGNLYIGEVGDPNSRRIRKVICPIGDDDSDGVCNGFEEELEQPASEQVSIQVPQTKVFVVPTQKAAGGSSLTGAVVGVPPVGSWIVVALVVLIGLCFIVYNVTHSTRRLK
jgi:sugar lactone lactonase YvrE